MLVYVYVGLCHKISKTRCDRVRGHRISFLTLCLKGQFLLFGVNSFTVSRDIELLLSEVIPSTKIMFFHYGLRIYDKISKLLQWTLLQKWVYLTPAVMFQAADIIQQ